MNRQIDRLRAEEDLRQIQLLGSATSQESYAAIIDRLDKQMGDVAVIEPGIRVLNLDDNELDPDFDREGLHALMGRTAPSAPEDK